MQTAKYLQRAFVENNFIMNFLEWCALRSEWKHSNHSNCYLSLKKKSIILHYPKFSYGITLPELYDFNCIKKYFCWDVFFFEENFGDQPAVWIFKVQSVSKSKIKFVLLAIVDWNVHKWLLSKVWRKKNEYEEFFFL